MKFNHKHQVKVAESLIQLFYELEFAIEDGRLRDAQKIQNAIEERAGSSHIDWKVAYEEHKRVR